MSADWVKVAGRFKTDIEKLDDIKTVLAENLPEYFEEDVIDLKVVNGYVELEYEESWGRCGSFSTYLGKNFIKSYPDVLFEVFYLLYDPEGQMGDRLVYDGKQLKTEEIGASFDGEDFIFNQPCPECGGLLQLNEGYCYCEECDEEFSADAFDLTEYELYELYSEKMSGVEAEMGVEFQYIK